MKLLIWHLSDIHFNSNSNWEEINVYEMVKSLSSIGRFEACVCFISGDIAFSGKAEEYNEAKRFIGSLFKWFKKCYKVKMNIYVVPGNHDNEVRNLSRSIKDVKRYYSDNVKSHFFDDLKELTNFYKFANENNSFRKSKVFEVQSYFADDFKIKINLINTAPFSLISDCNADKGIHYLPGNELSKFDYDKEQNYTITVMHHTVEWFDDTTKNILQKYLQEKTDLLLTGHDHVSQSEQKITNGKHPIDISRGMSLYGTNSEHGFKALLLDTDSKTLEGIKFDYIDGEYVCKEDMQRHEVVLHGKYKFTFTKDFSRKLELDSGLRSNQSFLNYFVFPSLEAKDMRSDNKHYTISNFEQFYDLLKKKKVVYVQGDSRTGKTTLSKYLCGLMSKEYVPLYLNAEDFLISDNKKMIIERIRSQYGNNSKYEEYESIAKERKCLIVDEQEKISEGRWKKFWNEYRDGFDLTVIFSSDGFSLDIKEKAIEDLLNKSAYELKICPFYYEKRGEYVKKICEFLNKKRDYTTDEQARKINDDITGLIEYFRLTPDFIYQYVHYCVSYPYGGIGVEKTNVFNKVYESNIIMSIAEATGDGDVQEILMALEYVGFYAHVNKNYHFTREDFARWVTKYGEEYDNPLNVKKVLRYVMDAKIITETQNDFCLQFSDSSMYSYFVASRLNRLLLEEKGYDEMKELIENIHISPNGDIILFLSYITNNVKVLSYLMECAEKLMDEWEELSFDNKNINYLSYFGKMGKITKPSIEEKKQVIKEKDSFEQTRILENNNKIDNMYSLNEEDVDSFVTKVDRSFGYLNILAKILPNFRASLKADERKRLIEDIYRLPNKLLYGLLKDVDNNFEEIVNEILEEYNQIQSNNTIKKETVRKLLKQQSAIVILSVYDFMSSIASNSKTITYLNKKEYVDIEISSNYRAMNLLMEESAGNFGTFSYKAENFYKSTKLDVVKIMIPMIVRKFFLCHEVNIDSRAQHVIDMFFQEKEKANLKISQFRNQSTKK